MRRCLLLALCLVAGMLCAEEPTSVALSLDELVERDLGWTGIDDAPDPATLRHELRARANEARCC